MKEISVKGYTLNGGVFMSYDEYKAARDFSWQCLINCKISSLPISLSKVCRQYGYTIVKDSHLSDKFPIHLSENQRSKCFIDERVFILVKDTESIPVQWFSVAHEIGHIFLGHVPAERLTKEQELTADRFAADLLAPACVLWGLNLHMPEEISTACNISITSARIRAERMEVLYTRGKFLLHPLERQVYKQFEEFIRNYKK